MRRARQLSVCACKSVLYSYQPLIVMKSSKLFCIEQQGILRASFTVSNEWIFGFILRQEIERQEREKIRQEWVEEQEKIKSENLLHFSLVYRTCV